jgi:osmotically-inducible protein OsmY
MCALTLAAGVVQTAAADDSTNDATIAEAVKAKLAAKDPEFLRAGDVEVAGGVVTLKGAVIKPADLVKALHEAGNVPGVVKVVNRVIVRS